MDENNNYKPKYVRESDPWEESSWQTGSTNPPKNRGGLIALLLVLVIFLSGIVTVLGILNVKLFQQLKIQEQQEELAISYNAEPDTTEIPSEEVTPALTEETQPLSQDPIDMELTPAPASVDNIPVDGGLPLQEIYLRSIDSVVSISCQLQSGSSTGTGVVLTQDGYIVTNCHVVENAYSVTVQLTDGRVLPARLVGADAVSDLAVLQVDAQDLIPAPFGDSDNLRVGDTVVAIGDPLGVELRGTLTDGIISAINRDLTTGGRTLSLIQTSAALNSGNSGGPLVNCYGQVVGINTMKIGDYASSAGVEGLGFAIPMTTVKDVVEQLLNQGYVAGRPTLGLEGQMVSTFYQMYYRLPAGLMITAIDPASDAFAKGLQTGDILLYLDGRPVSGPSVLSEVVNSHAVGESVNVILYRAGQEYAVDLTVTEEIH